MRIASAINDSIVDGPGLRYTVFTQGCPHHCPGCHNPATHDPAGGEEQAVSEAAVGLENPLIQGLTLSGGEPFLQAEDCAELAELAQKKGLDVWTYTGYTYEELMKAEDLAWNRLLAATDVLVDGPFTEARRSYTHVFRGSANQRLVDVKASRVAGQVVLWQRKDPLAHFTPPES